VFHGAAAAGELVATNPLFGFDNASDWSSPQTAVTSDPLTTTEGEASLAVTPNGWTEVVSRTFDTSLLASMTSTLAIDLFVPLEQPNPSWVGALQLYVDCPTAGLHNRYIGQNELRHTFLGEFNRLRFTLPPDVTSALSGTLSGCSLRLALNVSPGSGTWRLDNLGFVAP
jgi:hypothetical protein